MAPNIKLSFGPMLIGTYLNLILFGILIMQTYHYYLTYKQDVKWIKLLVLYLFVLEVFNSIADMHIMWQPLVQNFGNADAIKLFPTLFAAEPLVIVLVSTPIQFFFAWRVLVLTKSKWLAGVIILTACVSFGGGIWTMVGILVKKTFARKQELHWSALTWFLAACISDVLITVALTVALRKRKTGFASTDDAIQKIIRMTVQTGAITAFFAIGDVVFFMTIGHTALNFIWDMALAKLYANCLLSTLNARNALKESINSNQFRHPSSRSQSSNMRKAAADTFDPPSVTQQEYELQLGSQAGVTSFGDKSIQFAPMNQDNEYGISITKVIERRQDP